MQYIYRDALMKEFSDFVRDSNNSDFAPTPTWNDAVSLVGSVPTADVVERKNGKWICVDGVRCSNCNHKLQTTGLPTYCPNCGAEMRKELNKCL